MKHIIEILLNNKYTHSDKNIYHRNTIDTSGNLKMVKVHISLDNSPHKVNILDKSLNKEYEFTFSSIIEFNRKVCNYPEILGLEIPAQEYIICAAIKRIKPNVVKSKQVMYKHKSLWEFHGKIDDIYFIETARRHPEIIHRWRDKLSPDKNDEGFYTSYGRFVDRKLGLKIAIESGQVIEGSTINETKLFSEDLY